MGDGVRTNLSSKARTPGAFTDCRSAPPPKKLQTHSEELVTGCRCGGDAAMVNSRVWIADCSGGQ